MMMMMLTVAAQFCTGYDKHSPSNSKNAFVFSPKSFVKPFALLVNVKICCLENVNGKWSLSLFTQFTHQPLPADDSSGHCGTLVCDLRPKNGTFPVNMCCLPSIEMCMQITINNRQHMNTTLLHSFVFSIYIYQFIKMEHQTISQSSILFLSSMHTVTDTATCTLLLTEQHAHCH